MRYVLTAAQMQRADKETTDRFGVPALVLMERAALACAERLEEQFPIQAPLVVCGHGNNGGDGFAIARILKEHGYEPVVWFVGAEDKCTEETKRQRQVAEAYGVPVIADKVNMPEGAWSVVTDSIFGIGLSRPVTGSYEAVIRQINEAGCPVLSVDIPSGINSDTGQVMGAAVKADCTVTFGFYKAGQLLYPGREYCGECVVRDVGITARSLGDGAYGCTYEPSDMDRLPLRQAGSNKGTYGKVLMIAGSPNMNGAAYLSAMAAYRAGAGLVQVLTAEENRHAIQVMAPEAVCSFYGKDGPAEEQLAACIRWATVVGIGPGLSASAAAMGLFERVMAMTDKPLVVDADGLNLLCRRKELAAAYRDPLILTPHIGELSRLTGQATERLKEDLPRWARETAEEYGCVTAAKDACTVVSDGSRCYYNTSGNNGMSTGGSGDVLTGVICGLLAQGMAPWDAACLGVYLHGCAGDQTAEETGVYGLTAGKLLKGLAELTGTGERLFTSSQAPLMPV